MLPLIMARLAESSIRSVCRELLATPGKCSGRALRRELQARFQMSGKTQRVFAIWREEQHAALQTESQRRLASAESKLLDESAEIQRLRDEVAQLKSEVMLLRSR